MFLRDIFIRRKFQGTTVNTQDHSHCLRCRDIPVHTDKALLTESYPQLGSTAIYLRSADFFCKRYAEELRTLISSLPFAEDELDNLLMPVLWGLISYVNLLPASEYHHHSGAGGLFVHSLQCAQAAVSYAENRAFDNDATPEKVYHNRKRWILAVVITVLLHDIGKVFDMQVQSENGEIWNPSTESLISWSTRTQVRKVYVVWNQDREHKKHQLRALRLIYSAIFSKELFEYLTEISGSSVLDAMEEAIVSDKGIFLEVLRRAERFSIEKDMKARRGLGMDSTNASSPLLMPFISTLRHLLVTGKWAINTQDSRIFLTSSGLYLRLTELAAKEIHQAGCQLNVPFVPGTTQGLLRIMTEGGLLGENQTTDEGQTLRAPELGSLNNCVKLNELILVCLSSVLTNVKPLNAEVLKDVKKDEGYTRASLDLKARLVAPQHDFLTRKSATHHQSKSNISIGSEQNALLLTEAEFNEVCEGTPNPEELKKLIERFLFTLQKQVRSGSGFFIENLVILDDRTRSISSHKVEEFLANHGIGTNLQKMVFRMKRDLPNIDFDPNSHCLKFDLGSLSNEKESGKR